MKLQVYVGPQGVGFEFETTEERDRFFDGLGRNPSATGFTPQQAATKLGPNAIKIDPAKMKVGYKWPLQSVPMPVTVPRSNGRVSSEMPPRTTTTPPRTPAREEKTVTQLPPQIPIAPVVVLNPGTPPQSAQSPASPPALIPMPEVSEVPKEEPKAETTAPVTPPTEPPAPVKRGPGRPRKNP